MNKMTPVIDLTGGFPGKTGNPGGNGRLSLQNLQMNYDALLRNRIIHYPVPYQFLRELGRGRQGHVYLAQRQGARGCMTEYAIKLYDPCLYHSPEEYWTDMGRIAFQISRLQRVQSPNVVSRHLYEETYGIGYVQMEAVDGLDLSRLLSPENISRLENRCGRRAWSRFSQTIFRRIGSGWALQPGMVVYIMRGLLRGLERLHHAGFLHYDVKPGNIMVDRLGSVKVIDFGRAVMSGESLSFLLGSPFYMAPETHRREPGTAQSDLFSVGLVALELLRGRPLVETDAETDEQRLLDIKSTLAERLEGMLPAYVVENERLMEILRRLLAFAPQERFVDARDAESGKDGLVLVDKQLVHAGLDTEYARELSDCLAYLEDPATQRLELLPSTSIDS